MEWPARCLSRRTVKHLRVGYTIRRPDMRIVLFIFDMRTFEKRSNMFIKLCSYDETWYRNCSSYMNIFIWYEDCTYEHGEAWGLCSVQCTVYIIWWIFGSIYLNSAIFRATALCDHGARASFFLVGGEVFWCYWIFWRVAQEVGVCLKQNIMCILSWGDWWLLIDWWLWDEMRCEQDKKYNVIWIRETLKNPSFKSSGP